jgi:hypothetical protein
MWHADAGFYGSISSSKPVVGKYCFEPGDTAWAFDDR